MTHALFRCDGAQVPDAWRAEAWDVQQSLDHRGPDPNVYLSIENLSHALMGRVVSRAADLVRIAAYTFAADQRVSRGGRRDVHAKDWRWRMALAVPVNDSDFWMGAPVITALRRAADFASEDDWDFAFTPASPETHQLQLNMPPDRSDRAVLADLARLRLVESRTLPSGERGGRPREEWRARAADGVAETAKNRGNPSSTARPRADRRLMCGFYGFCARRSPADVPVLWSGDDARRPLVDV